MTIVLRQTALFALLVLVFSACAAPQEDAGAEGERQGAVALLMETSLGPVAIDVYPEQAPITAGNFLQYVKNGHYDGGAFYRTVTPENDNNPLPINVIQGGVNPLMSGDFEAPLPPIAHEGTAATGLRHDDGALSMARFTPGTAQSEFFISIGDNPVLDEGGMRNPDGLGFAVFGRVTDGMEIIRAIHQMPATGPAPDPYVEGQVLEPAVEILSIRRAP